MADTNKTVTAEEFDEGYHFCVEWDGLLICPADLEWSVCSCAFPSLEIRAKHDAAHKAAFPNGYPGEAIELDLTQDDE